MSFAAPAGDDLWPRVSRALDAVYALEGEARRAELERLAAADPAVWREVAALLAADPGTSRMLDAAARGAAEDLPATMIPGPVEVAGVRVGDWRLIRLIGRGGMGEVYLAERADGSFEQRVALKLLKRGLDSEELVARFVRERQILARLAHPGIARLYDGGVASDGRPFFALEHVEGLTITEHADRAELGVEARIDLFLAVCAAVEAAHRSLVVHRDLKPSNVLVAPDGTVKLLDFGIAKLLETDDPALATRTETRMMTPAYAAPEQILGGPVTTATDVFALGAMLYELLVGRRPFRREGRTPTDLALEVRRERLVRPSDAVRARARETVSPDERAALERRARRLTGDLDAILLQALEVDAARRYATVEAFAEDLRRHRGGHPVQAHGDTMGYRARKFVARHRAAVAAVALATLALAIGLAVALGQAVKARRALARAERVRSFLVSVFEVTDPAVARGEDVTARRLLDEGARRVERELAGEPRLAAEMLDLLAGLYRKLGALEPARDLAMRSVALAEASAGPASVEAARGRWTLGWVLLNQGRFDEARAALGAAIERLDRAAGGDEVLAADAREPLVELEFSASGPAAALPVAERRLAIYRRALGDENAKTALALNDVGVIHQALGRNPAAVQAFAGAAAVLERLAGPDDPRLALVLSNSASLEKDLGRLDAAEAAARRALDIRRRTLGARHPETGVSASRLAGVLVERGSFAEAETLCREAIAVLDGVDEFQAAGATGVLAEVLAAAGRDAESLAAYDDSIRRYSRMVGPEHVLVLDALVEREAVRARDPAHHAAAVAELERLVARLAALGEEGSAFHADAVDALAAARGRG